MAEGLTFNTEAIKAIIESATHTALVECAQAVEKRAKEACPVLTDRLRGSIHVEFGGSGENEYARIGTNVEYAGAVEFGTSSSHTIVPTNGRFLSWVDKSTGQRIFARKVTIPPHAGKPYLTPAYNNWKDKYPLRVAQIIKGKIGEGH
jgi:hypothetical protein